MYRRNFNCYAKVRYFSRFAKCGPRLPMACVRRRERGRDAWLHCLCLLLPVDDGRPRIGDPLRRPVLPASVGRPRVVARLANRRGRKGDTSQPFQPLVKNFLPARRRQKTCPSQSASRRVAETKTLRRKAPHDAWWANLRRAVGRRLSPARPSASQGWQREEACRGKSVTLHRISDTRLDTR